MKCIAMGVSAAALMTVFAPAASASEAVTAEPVGCTTVLLGEAGGWVPTHMPNDWVEVTYTPPAGVDVNANTGVNFVLGVAGNIAGDVVAYVICVV